MNIFHVDEFDRKYAFGVHNCHVNTQEIMLDVIFHALNTQINLFNLTMSRI